MQGFLLSDTVSVEISISVKGTQAVTESILKMKCSRSNMILNISLNILFLFILRENVLVLGLISFLAPFFMDFMGDGDYFQFLVSYILWGFMDHNICKLGGQMIQKFVQTGISEPITNIKNNRNTNFHWLELVLSSFCNLSNWCFRLVYSSDGPYSMDFHSKSISSTLR